ncbi:MAG TPA: molybdopterin cofactor-binding domain-containing protein [Alphaproteobacteria bacterium]|nr:molybdopterin cofactor-binding domain-containing protein [Alphaproteobacteria bacterium]
MKSPAASLSRRRFLAAGSSLTFAVLAGGAVNVRRTLAQTTAAAVQTPVNAWVSIARDGFVTIRYGAAEMGQGVMTAIPMILAEELDADWSKVRVEPVTHDPATYGNPKTGGVLYTAGSTSVEGYFEIMRRAGAAARRVLIYSAAHHWSVPVAEVTTEPGKVIHARSGRQLAFGDVAALPRIVSEVPPIADGDLKPPTAYRLIGQRIPRLDIPAKTRGEAIYSIDIRVPGMAYAAVLRAPVEGEAAAVIDDAAARAVPGVLAISPLEEGVGVVAERWETALAARDALKVTWTRRSPFRTADSDADLARDAAAAADLGRPGTVWEARGDAPAVLRAAARIVEAEYATDHVYHAQMEPLAAVASVDEDGKGAEIWVGTQSQTVTLGVATQVLGTTPDRIRFHAVQMGGGFGRRTFFGRELLRDALILSRMVRRPVKLIWTREDDVRNGWFRPATAHKLRAALNPDGSVAAWHHRIACPSIFGFVAPQRLAAAGNRDLLIMEGTEIADYGIPNLLSEHLITERRARVSAWRGIGWGHNLYATESFIDELAHAAATDALTFRRRLLAGRSRALRVLEAVVAMSDYGRPAPGRAHGLSFGGYRASFGAAVAEISLDSASGEIRVHRFWAAIDPGLVIQPQNIVAQVEGGIVYGLSGLLRERITIKGGEVQESNFHDYSFLRMQDVPDIEVQVLRSDAAPGGAGEIGVPMTGAAVANAFHVLTGKRLRHMPFTPDRVRQVLSA